MAQIVIEIPDSKYQSMQNGYYCGLLDADMYKAIKDGVPLPKGHGRWLILSEDKVKENQMTLDFSCQKWINEVALSNSIVAIVKAESEDKE